MHLIAQNKVYTVFVTGIAMVRTLEKHKDNAWCPAFIGVIQCRKTNQLIEWSAAPNATGTEFEFIEIETPDKPGQEIIDTIQSPTSGAIGMQILHLIKHNSSLQSPFYDK